MMAVTRRPMNKPVNGFDVAMMIVSAALAPRCCNDEIIKSNARRKTNNAASMYAVFRRISFQPGCGDCVSTGCTSSGRSIPKYKQSVQRAKCNDLTARLCTMYIARMRPSLSNSLGAEYNVQRSVNRSLHTAPCTFWVIEKVRLAPSTPLHPALSAAHLRRCRKLVYERKR